MRRTVLVIAVAAAALAAGGCTQAPASASARRAPPAAMAAGKPISCVQTTLIDRTQVYGDDVIDFHMRGGQVYRNTLPNRCPSLGFEQRFAYHTSTGELCSVDTITVLQSGSQIAAPTCGLGKFQPVTLAR